MNIATRQISLKKNRGFEQQYKPVRPNKIYIYRIFHPTTAEHTFFSSTQEILQKRPYARR